MITTPQRVEDFHKPLAIPLRSGNRRCRWVVLFTSISQGLFIFPMEYETLTSQVFENGGQVCVSERPALRS